MMPDLTAKAPVAMHLWITGHGSLCSSAISFSQAAVNKLLGALFRTYKERGGLARGSKKPPQASEQHQPAGGDTDAETCLAAPSSVNLDVLIRALRKKKPENFLTWSPNPRLGLNPPKSFVIAVHLHDHFVNWIPPLGFISGLMGATGSECRLRDFHNVKLALFLFKQDIFVPGLLAC